KFKKKILNTIIIGLFILCAIEFYVIKGIGLIESYGIESKYIFYSTIFVEIGIVSILSFYRILNSFYLTDSWKDNFIYPVSDGISFLAKFILVCYQNFAIVIGFLLPLVTYGIVIGLKAEYYLKLLIYQLLIAVIPSIYIILSSLTILWIIVVIKKAKIKNKVNKLILVIDIDVDILTIMAIMDKEKIVLSLILTLIISIFGFYFIAGSVYTTIMRSEVFGGGKSRVVEESTDTYKFKKINIIKSNVIKDLRIIKREKALKTNCLIINFVFCFFSLIFILGAIKSINIDKLKGMEVVLIAILLQICIWPLSIINNTAFTSFSREGSGLKVLKTFPIDKNRYILSKFCTACITFIPVLVLGNALIFLLAMGIIKYIILELILVSTIVLMILSNMKMDSENSSLGWSDIKDLFELERTMKLIKPVNIAYIILLPYFCIRAFVIDAGTNNYIEVFILIAINVLLSLHNLKKVKSNFKFRI
ncbi:MAG: hypothetical protein K5986_08910, partial [Clostridium sp.]|nr:hypothetical protein [Clostridium sp.]